MRRGKSKGREKRKRAIIGKRVEGGEEREMSIRCVSGSLMGGSTQNVERKISSHPTRQIV